MTSLSRTWSGCGLAVGLAATASLVLAAGPSWAAAMAPSASRFAGVWITRSVIFQQGAENALSANFTTTAWAPLSAGRPEDVKFADLETQRKAAIARVKADSGGFGGGARRPNLPFTPAGEAAADKLFPKAAPGGAKSDPYARCLPKNLTSLFALAAYASGLSVFANGAEFAVLTDNTTRVVHIGAKAEAFAPSYNGVSVAHWDGDRLVIETSHWLGDSDGSWPMSPDARLTETIWLSPDGKVLNIKGVYEDKAYLKEPIGHMTYLKRGGPYYDPLPTNCVEEVKGAEAYDAEFGGPPENRLPLGADVPKAQK